MRLEYVCFHNMGPFAHLEVDFAKFGPARFIAITGENGKGKTYFLEGAMAGAAHRKMPTQGTLAERATAKDSYQVSRLVNGQSWTIKHLIDAVTGDKRTVVKGPDGAPYEGTGVTQFDEWSAAHLLNPDLMFATIFATQKLDGNKAGRAFIALTSAERISVILQTVGVARLERMAELARERLKVSRAALEALRSRIADVRAAAAHDPALVREEHDQALIDVEREDQALVELRAALAEAEAKERALVELRAEARRFADAAACRLVAIEKQREAVADTEERIRNNELVMADAPAIVAAVDKLPRIRAAIEKSEREAAGHDKTLAVLTAETCALEDAAADATRQVSAAQTRGVAILKRLAEEKAALAAVAGLVALREQLSKADADVASAEAALEEARGRRVAGADERCVGLRGGLEQIVAAPLAAEHRARETLAEDDRLVALAAEPSRVLGLEVAVRDCRERRERCQREVAAAERLAAREAEMMAARVELDEVRALEAGLHARQEEATAAARERRAALAPLEALATAARAATEKHRKALADHERVAARAPALSTAEARLAELRPRAVRETGELARLESEHAALPAPPAVPEGPNLEAARHFVRESEALTRGAHAALARAAQRLEQALAVQERAAPLEAEREAAEAELADWTRLSMDLGRGGLQSAEVDSAGPELTTIVNDLLHSCHGPRFTVQIETTRPSSGGREIDDCRIVVTDTEERDPTAREREARKFSGGERTIISEAVSLGLTLLACRRAGIERPTLIRDESDGFLSPANARVYMAMLRRAADILDADRVLFVSHSAEVIELADDRIDLDEVA